MKHNFLLLSLALSGCVFGPPPVPSQDGCGAARFGNSLGQDVSTVVMPTDQPSRIVGPDTMVTTDYVSDRVNFETDSFGIITRITCG